MEAKDNIKFEIISHDSSEPEVNNHDCDSDESVSSQENYQVLSKVVDVEVLSRATITEQIDETEVTVNLQLSQDERLLLQCSPSLTLFNTDALKAIEKNIRHSEERGLILPVYSGELEQKFWLFYTSISPRSLLKMSNDDEIEGLWLDIMPSKESESSIKYKLLTNHPDSVINETILKSKIGPLYFCQKLTLKKTTVFVMPAVFYNSINRALKELKLM